MDAPDPDFERFNRALAHPVRRDILTALCRRDSAVSPRDLVEELDEELRTLAYQFRVLLAVHLIELAKTEAARGMTRHYYRLGPGFTPDLADTLALDQIAELLAREGSELPPAIRREILEIVAASGRPIVSEPEDSEPAGPLEAPVEVDADGEDDDQN